MHEELLSNEQLRIDEETRRNQDEEDRRQPDVVEGLRAQRAVLGKRRFTRASVEASARWTARCSSGTPSINAPITSASNEQDTPRNLDPEESRSPLDDRDPAPRSSDNDLDNSDDTTGDPDIRIKEPTTAQDTRTRPAQAFLRIPPSAQASG